MMTDTQGHHVIGEIETPRPLRFYTGLVEIAGWALFRGQPDAPEVRLRCQQTEVRMTGRIKRPDLRVSLAEEPAASESGFYIREYLPPGIYRASFEARPSGATGIWVCFKRLTIAISAPDFAAAIDTPVASGTLRDRVKLGGWAVHRTQAIKTISLRYGHRTLACDGNQTRTDAHRILPESPDAGRSGFTTSDFLVAGCGTARIYARLADDTIRIQRSSLNIEILEDENHDSKLELRAPRVPLPYQPPSPEAGEVRRSDQTNVLFVLPGSFASNSALHVAALANQLSMRGHACAVAASGDPETMGHLYQPRFAGWSHADAGRVTFPNGAPVGLIHAWTTRECVRLLVAHVRQHSSAKLVVHLEDNEQEILSQHTGMTASQLESLDDRALGELVSADHAHPHRSREFLRGADGVTTIVDRLQEFVPAGKPTLTIWPAADSRYFHAQAAVPEFRRELQLEPGAILLFYHGNIHAANLREMGELYAAVVRLNESGQACYLMRTGLDYANWPDDLASRAAPFVINLGLIQRHHHLPALMANADMFVQPGGPGAFNDYRFPSKLPEFFSIGRPVILPRTNLGAIARHGVDAWVLDQADADGIVRAVLTIARDRTVHAKLSQGALAFAARHFNWARSAESLAGFYDQLTAS